MTAVCANLLFTLHLLAGEVSIGLGACRLHEGVRGVCRSYLEYMQEMENHRRSSSRDHYSGASFLDKPEEVSEGATFRLSVQSFLCF